MICGVFPKWCKAPKSIFSVCFFHFYYLHFLQNCENFSYSGGELFQRVIDTADTLSEKDIAQQFMKQICKACSYLASKNVVHLDIKPENVMCTNYDENCLVKVCFDKGPSLYYVRT